MKKVTLTEMKKKRNRKTNAVEKELGCKFIRINADAENYDIFVEVSKIQNHIIKSTKKTYCLSCKRHTHNIGSKT